jgi:hypothetical protein
MVVIEVIDEVIVSLVSLPVSSSSAPSVELVSPSNRGPSLQASCDAHAAKSREHNFESERSKAMPHLTAKGR